MIEIPAVVTTTYCGDVQVVVGREQRVPVERQHQQSRVSQTELGKNAIPSRVGRGNKHFDQFTTDPAKRYQQSLARRRLDLSKQVGRFSEDVRGYHDTRAVCQDAVQLDEVLVNIGAQAFVLTNQTPIRQTSHEQYQQVGIKDQRAPCHTSHL